MKMLEDALLRSALSRRRFLMYMGAVGLSVSAGSVLEACESSTSATATPTAAGTPPTQPTGRLRFAHPYDLVSLDPARDVTAAPTHNMYDGLTRFNAQYTKLEGALAESWESNADATEWIFHLRQGVTFHDGEALDSTAVKKSFEYYKNGVGLPFSFLAGPFTAIDDSDPRTVRIMYKQPFADLARNQQLQKIYSPKLLAGSIDAAMKRTATSPAGAGPFKYVSSTPGTLIEMEAFENYWGRAHGDGPFVKQLEWRILQVESTRLAALQSGDVDLVRRISPPLLAQIRQNPNLATSSKQTWQVQDLKIDTSLAPTNDVRVRKAVMYGINKQQIAGKLLLKHEILLDGNMPSGLYGQKTPSTKYSYNPDQAKALLKQTGLSLPLPIIMEVAQGALELGEETLQAMAAQLESVGFKVTTRVLDLGVLQGDVFGPNRTGHIAYDQLGWVNGGPIHFALGVIPAATKYTGSDLGDLITKITTLPDGPDRLKALADAQELCADKVIDPGLFQIVETDAFTRKLQGWIPPGDGNALDFRHAYFAQS